MGQKQSSAEHNLLSALYIDLSVDVVRLEKWYEERTKRKDSRGGEWIGAYQRKDGENRFRRYSWNVKRVECGVHEDIKEWGEEEEDRWQKMADTHVLLQHTK